nr:immunoglobulin light chain junction region [Macaca mulatta]MOW67643.1 immunoglobulin light chain junction region [Macaca mulatta]MOW70483.1 immunoglobulin light chain junction region [Macaca mulatta]MOW72287.1 immunoglobulin light chain junction region [Macaca mulatta]
VYYCSSYAGSNTILF